MATKLQRQKEEVWQSQIPGTIWVEKTDQRGNVKPVKVLPHGILRITTEDRILCQEKILDLKVDPFTNGMLIRQDEDQQADETTRTPNAVTTEELMAAFLLPQDEFERKVASWGELPVRRLRELAEDADTKYTQVRHLDEVIAKRWPIGGDTPVYRELMKADEIRAG